MSFQAAVRAARALSWVRRGSMIGRDLLWEEVEKDGQQNQVRLLNQKIRDH